MMRATDLIAQNSPLDREELEIWIREELVVAVRDGSELVFTDRECARIRLIRTLRYELEVERDTLPVVLSLLDQLYETRGRFRALAAAVAAEQPAIRDAILARLAPEDTPED
jgi:chaperone modulatory protein CbpM